MTVHDGTPDGGGGHRWWLVPLSSYIGYSMGAFIFTMLRATRPRARGAKRVAEQSLCGGAASFAPHPHCRSVKEARSVPGAKLPPFTQHWTRCDLGVTAGSRDCLGKAK